MIERLRQLRERFGDPGDAAQRPHPLRGLRAATAQLLVATAAGATIDHLQSRRRTPHFAVGSRDIPLAFRWAPVLIGPLAAAAHLEHARRASEQTATAVRILDGAALLTGAALALLSPTEEGAGRATAISFASAGLLGLTLDREERTMEGERRELERRARVVERLVPKPRRRLERVVVHV